jgi:hypothetical protein
MVRALVLMFAMLPSSFDTFFDEVRSVILFFDKVLSGCGCLFFD